MQENRDFSRFLDEVVSDFMPTEEHCDIPLYVISGSGDAWFLDPEAHQMVKISRGTEVVPISDDADIHDRMLVRAPYRFLLIPETEIQEIGWN